MPNYEQYFESMSEYVAHVSTRPVSPVSQYWSHDSSMGANWYGTKTFGDAVDLYSRGWKEGTEAIEKFSSGFANVVGSRMVEDQYFYDVTGQDFDLSRVIEGEPECWLDTRQVEVNAPSKQIIKLVVNISASAAVNPDAIMTRGAAIAALVVLLERAKRRVEVEVIECCTARGSEVTMVNRIRVKPASADIDLAKLAFVLGHPAMLRRFAFAANENFSNRRVATVMCNAGYGSPSDDCDDKGDLYMGRLFGSFTEADAIEWITGTLVSMGVELKAGE